ncbi:suppressor of fused homolog [Montipora capricornis]|uniref:suppressor of fused homolog n=1 Tax=Montipora capricornis TaxID=246305 RepID=UPI0035F12D7D
MSGGYRMPMPAPPTPRGLEAIYSTLRQIYPDQPNPLQVTALVKYWLGGPDPLDFISMFNNPGSPMDGIPSHWHYISSGLSDLHGDGRVHEVGRRESPSGFGFELTFRLKKQVGESSPPSWPAELLQSLARYVFRTENALYSGDHVSWHLPLDQTPSAAGQYNCNPSHIQHMLMVDDPQLPLVTSPLGSVRFIQAVGICTEELQAAQHWNGPSVLDLLRKVPPAGGPWLITDMDRIESIFVINPELQEIVGTGIKREGSNLSGVSVKCWWEEHYVNTSMSGEHGGFPSGSYQDSHTGKDVATRFPVLPPIPSGSSLMPKKEMGDGTSSDRKSACSSVVSEISRTRTLRAVHLRFGFEAAMLLPLALRGRLNHGRHFTFHSSVSNMAITFLTPKVTGSITDNEHKFAACGMWLQVLITDDFLHRLDGDLDELTRPKEVKLPREYRWPRYGLVISVLPDE